MKAFILGFFVTVLSPLFLNSAMASPLPSEGHWVCGYQLREPIEIQVQYDAHGGSIAYQSTKHPTSISALASKVEVVGSSLAMTGSLPAPWRPGTTFRIYLHDAFGFGMISYQGPEGYVAEIKMDCVRLR